MGGETSKATAPPPPAFSAEEESVAEQQPPLPPDFSAMDDLSFLDGFTSLLEEEGGEGGQAADVMAGGW